MGVGAININVARVEGGYKLNFRGDFRARECVAETDEKVRDLVNKALDQLLRSKTRRESK